MSTDVATLPEILGTEDENLVMIQGHADSEHVRIALALHGMGEWGQDAREAFEGALDAQIEQEWFLDDDLGSEDQPMKRCGPADAGAVAWTCVRLP